MRKLLHLTFFAVSVGVFATAAEVAADPIYVETGGLSYLLGNTPAAVSWTQTDTWTDVVVSLGLFNICGEQPLGCGGGTTASGNVYLTDSIGAGTTQGANEIAATTLVSSTVGLQTVTAFSGLTLGPGTYYLVYSYGPDPLDLEWVSTFPQSVVVGNGVTAGPDYLYLGNLTGGYEPAEDPFYDDSEFTNPLFSITGTHSDTAVPEPGSLLLFGIGMGLLAKARHRGKQKAQNL